MGVMFINYDESPIIYGRICTAIGLLQVYTEWTKLLFTMWVTFHLFCFAVLHKNLKKLEVLYVVTSLLVPALIAIVPLVTHSYGLNTDGNICNIYANTNVAFIERLALWDCPAMLMLIAASIAMVVMVIKLASQNELQTSNCCLGYRAMWRLLQLKYRYTIKRSTVMMLLAVMDPIASRLRKVKRLTRRTYVNKASDQPHVCSYLYLELSVLFQGPNWCWHIDGYDKLKPFGFPIHACIDGFSWKIIWLELTATNNDPNVVVKFYLDAVVSLKTLQAMPTSQAAPNVTALNAVTALSNPNGLLIHTCGPSSPLILNTNSSSMSLQWNAPLQPDYVITAYTLHHRVPSLKSQSEMWAPPSTATVQFYTYNPSGILFYQINSVMTDFLEVLQSRPQALHSSWNVALSVISAAASLPRYIVYTSIT
eukprot:Em0007g484a